GGADRRGRVRPAPRPGDAHAAAPLRRAVASLAPAGLRRRPRGAVRRLPDFPRAVRDPRDLPVVRHLRSAHRPHLPAVATRPRPRAGLRRMTQPGGAAAVRERSHGAGLAGLALAALGVVYGDIGTSPLYAVKECFLPEHHLPPTPENVLGILSLIFWSLSFVVSFKYITVLLRADNRGEGGILALLALVRPAGEPRGARRALVLLGLFGAALLYGDGVITPAVSVLGALEGIAVATPALQRFIVPVAAAILIGLFLFRKRGTAGVGQVFGPIMIVWFTAIAVFGVRGILREPTVLRAINPWHAVQFFVDDRLAGFLILGSVVLVFTGGEALYADMGHFGRRPIRLAWFGMALPALLLNYVSRRA